MIDMMIDMVIVMMIDVLIDRILRCNESLVVEGDEDSTHVITANSFVGVPSDQCFHEIFNNFDLVVLFFDMCTQQIYHPLVIIHIFLPYTITTTYDVLISL